MAQFFEMQKQLDSLALQMAMLPDCAAAMVELQKVASKTRTLRVSTGSVNAGSTALVTVTWATAFADANYTAQASVVDATTTSLSLSVVHIEAVSASAITVRVLNNALGALTGTVHATAIHD